MADSTIEYDRTRDSDLNTSTDESSDEGGDVNESTDESSDDEVGDVSIEEDNEMEGEDSSNTVEVTVDEEETHTRPPLYSGSSFSSDMATVMILMYSLRHCLSYEAISDLLRLLKILLPYPNTIPSSFWCFRKYIKESCIVNHESHFFCTTCYDNVTDLSIPICPTCNSTNKPQSFTILPIEEQVASLFKRKDFYSALGYRFRRQKQQAENIEDIYDGDVYKCFSQGILSDQNNISFKHNTDGIAVFNSSGKDVWPVLLQINELPPNMRTQPENMILAGIWFGKQHPPINTIMQPLKQSLLSLQSSGIVVETYHHGPIHVRAILISGVYDIPAKSDVLGFGSHRGPYACTKCLHPGKVIRTAKGANLRVYPNLGESIISGIGEMRTNESILLDAHRAITEGNNVRGIQDLSVMFCFPHFNFVEGVAIDAMHGFYSGVTKALISLWFDSSNHSNTWYCGPSLLKVVNARLLSIKPPSNLSKSQRSLQERKYWKASEYQYFLLYYLVPCMENVLETRYFDHVVKLVTACYLLNKDSISADDIAESTRLINEFHSEFIHLYGERHATLNLHYLLHLPQSVRELGPLWANTCYEFENFNSVLKKLLHGTHKVDMQIAESIGFVHFVHSKMSSVNDEVLYQCCFLKTRQNKCNTIVDYDGRPTTVLPTKVKQLFLKDVGKLSSREYTRSSKRCDYIVLLLQNNEYHCGFIEEFIVISGRIKAKVLLLTNVIAKPAPHIWKYCYPLSRYNEVEISLNQIKEKCIFMDIQDIHYFYLALMPENFSSD